MAVVPISFSQSGMSPDSVEIAKETVLDPDGPGFVVFTSGTTGYSKGVVLRRYCFAAAPLEKGDSAVVNYNASHWLGGTKNIIDGLLTCKTVFALNTPGSSADVLDKFKSHHITHFVFNPALLRGIKQLLLGEGGELTPEKKAEASRYFGGITYFLSIGGLVDKDTVDFWTEVLGCPFQNRYGSTELGGLPTLGISNLKVRCFYMAISIQHFSDHWLSFRGLSAKLLQVSRSSSRREPMADSSSRALTDFSGKLRLTRTEVKLF